MQFTKVFFLFLIILYLGACTNGQKAETADKAIEAPSKEAIEKAKEEEQKKEEAERYLITSEGFYGIKIGGNSSDYADLLDNGMLRDGEGEFDVFYIKSGDNKQPPLGYLTETPNDGTAIENIFVTTPKAKTKEGIGIGTTYAEIESKLPDFEVHGSEVESRTHIFVDNLAFQLDFPSASYDLDKTKIPKEAKVIKIWIGNQAK